MIHQFRSVLSSIAERTDCGAGMPDGKYVQCVSLPFVGGLADRLSDCWQVLCGRAHVFRWPKHGDLEAATVHWRHRHASQVISAAYNTRQITSEQMHILTEWSGHIVGLPGYRIPRRIAADKPEEDRRG